MLYGTMSKLNLIILEITKMIRKFIVKIDCVIER